MPYGLYLRRPQFLKTGYLARTPRSCYLSASSMSGYDWQIVHHPTGYAFYGATLGNSYCTLKYIIDKRNRLTPRTTESVGWSMVISVIGDWSREAKAHAAGLQQNEFNPLCSPSLLRNHFEGSRGGRLASRRHAALPPTQSHQYRLPHTPLPWT
jgi:hypothetical protein